jgi:uncharacterized protein YkwD
MSAERRGREDRFPNGDPATDPYGMSRRAGEAWSADFRPDAAARGGRPGQASWRDDARPGRENARLDREWADSYQFDGIRYDELWREPSPLAGRGTSGPDAGQPWPSDDPRRDEDADDWSAGTQADQSWRYRSLAEDTLAEEYRVSDARAARPRTDTRGTGSAGTGSTPARRRRASDNRPAPADESWPGSRLADGMQSGGPSERGYGSRAAGSRYPAGPAGAGYGGRPAGDGYGAGRAGGGPTRGGHGGGTADGGYGDGLIRPHVVGGRRASDSWLAGNPVDEAGRVSGRVTAGRRGGAALGEGMTDRTLLDGRRTDGGWRDGGPGDGWGDSDGGESGKPAGRRRRRVVVSVLAAVAVGLAFGAYGLVRMHDGSTVARQEASSRPCAHPGSRCPGRSPGAPGTGAGTGSPVGGNSGVPGAPGSPAARASGRPSAAASGHAPASTPPAHSAAPPAPAPAPSAPAGQAGGASSAAAAQVLDVINQARAQQGLAPLAISPGLNTSSAQHTTVMASDCGLSHQCPGEQDLGTRLTDAGVHWTSAGENIGEGGPEPGTTAAITQMAVGMTQSMLAEKPPNNGHRLNILSRPFRFVGITVIRDAQGTVWMTQDFST